MNNKKTIFVSGAGPAGLTAAITIARFHGDFQGLENWTAGVDVLEELAELGINPGFEATPFREAVLYDANGREFPFRTREPLFYLVRRGVESNTLDHALREQAIASGVEIRFAEAAHHLPEGGIVAEGPRSADVIAVGYVFDTDMADGAFVAFSDSLAPKGYAYLLVHKGRGTVASCLFDDFHKEKVYLQATVQFFSRKSGLKMNNLRQFGGTGNYSYPRTARRGNILFAGESAGFQDALWGFGMRYAFLSGYLAALSLIEDSIENYDRYWRQRIAGLLRSSIVNRYLFDRLGDAGYAWFLRRMARAGDARQWLQARYAPHFLKSLLFPVASRVVRSNRRETICIMEGCDCTWCRCNHNSLPSC